MIYLTLREIGQEKFYRVSLELAFEDELEENIKERQKM